VKTQDRILALASECPTGISKADVYKKRIAQNAGQAEQLLEGLVEAGQLRRETSPQDGGGWTVTRYRHAKYSSNR